MDDETKNTIITFFLTALYIGLIIISDGAVGHIVTLLCFIVIAEKLDEIKKMLQDKEAIDNDE